MNYRPFDREIILENSKKIIELLDEVLSINGIVVEKDYSARLTSEMGKYIEDGSAYIVGAFDNERLLGFIWGYKRFFNQEERLHIYHFIVDKTCRGMGIGQQLLDIIIEYTRKNDINKIDLMATSSNRAVLDFYYKNNFIDERVLLSKRI